MTNKKNEEQHVWGGQSVDVLSVFVAAALVLQWPPAKEAFDSTVNAAKEYTSQFFAASQQPKAQPTCNPTPTAGCSLDNK